MQNLTLKIGQVIYYLVKSEGKLKPIRVVEEVIKKSLTGTEVVYMIQFPDQQGLIALDTLEGDIFTSPEEAYQSLTERSNAAIKRVVDGAVNRAKRFFPNAQKNDENNSLPFISEVNTQKTSSVVDQESEGQLIEGPDGQLMRVKSISLPESLK